MRRAALAVVVAACTGPSEPAPVPRPVPAAAPVPSARLPEPPAALGPALAHVAHASGAMLADVDACASCHLDVAAQWRTSAHAFASFNNPVYRVAVDRIRRERDPKTSRFCGGCHDVALLVDGAMDAEIVPTDLRAHAGISCATCHSIASARSDGNGSYDLDASLIATPDEASPASRAAHRERVGRAALRTAAMCSACHKAFLDPDTGNAAHLIGQDDATPWARSPYAKSDAARIDAHVDEQDCRGCHMPRVAVSLGDPGAKNGSLASHEFLGGHTWLAAMENDPARLARTQEFLRGRISLDVGGVRHGARRDLAGSEPIVLAPGELTTLEVVLRNLAVGHRFPGGVMDAQDAWVEVTVTDAHGRLVAQAGTDHERTGADPTAHTLSSYMAAADGSRATTRETHVFRAGVWNHTLAPRDAAVVGYAFVAPAEGYPLHVQARLRHRTRNLDMQRVSCEDARSDRGRTFSTVGLAKVARAIDPCKAQPVTEIAETTLVLSGPMIAAPALPGDTASAAFERRIAYGLGLSHALQERLDDAREPYVSAGALASSPRDRAIAIGGLALVAARQGRVEETFGLARDAESSFGDTHPAMQRARAEVLATTWRLAEAAPLASDVARRAPGDDSAWASAAILLESADDARAALDVARIGLALQPRDGDLLRVQALAGRTLGWSVVDSDRADEAFLARRAPDDAPGIRNACAKNVPGCANERNPVHVHTMR